MHSSVLAPDMPNALSPRLAAIVDALPLKPGMRVLEIGCGPGAAARVIARRLHRLCRVGALDGRHPRVEQAAMRRIASALRKAVVCIWTVAPPYAGFTSCRTSAGSPEERPDSSIAVIDTIEHALSLLRPGGRMDADLEVLSREQLISEVQKLRNAIRKHRDASGQELCWHHPALWSLLPEKVDPVVEVPAWPQFMAGCVRYRQSLDQQLPDSPRSTQQFKE
jgi:protein-L-isoaspartate O-methyltransferase